MPSIEEQDSPLPAGGRTLIVDATDAQCYPLPSAALLDAGEYDRIYIRPGIFEAWMINAKGEYQVENFAHNVPASEGDLERIAYSELEQKLLQETSAETMDRAVDTWIKGSLFLMKAVLEL